MNQLRVRLPEVIERVWVKSLLGVRVRSLLIVTAVAFVAIIVSIASNDDSTQGYTPGAEGAASIFPSESLSDWVSHARQMSVVTVVAEERIEPPARVYENDEGYVGRTVTIRIDKTVWHAAGVEPFADGTELSYTGWGWHYKNGEYIPFAQQLRMGERYFMPIVKGRDSYYPLTSDTRLPLEGDRVDPDLETNNPAVELTLGKTVDEVGVILEQTSEEIDEPGPELTGVPSGR